MRLVETETDRQRLRLVEPEADRQRLRLLDTETDRQKLRLIDTRLWWITNFYRDKKIQRRIQNIYEELQASRKIKKEKCWGDGLSDSFSILMYN